MNAINQKFIETSLQILKESGYFVDQLWHVNDIYLLCEQRGWPNLDLEEAKGVFDIFNELYDG